MAFDSAADRPRRVAVIGGGIAGLGAAHDLARDFEVTLFEAEPRLGGHARTRLAGRSGEQPVDTGFIVFNRATYPHLSALFDALDVPLAESEMSFGASLAGGRLEYGLRSADAIFAQRWRAADPRFLGMLRDILRFNARAEAAAVDETMTIGALLDQLGTGAWFRDHYLLPFAGAIWSTPTGGILEFPAAAMLRFFRNHALLSTSGQHQWYTVRGGSIEYVRRLEAAIRRRGGRIETGAAVEAVSRAGTVRVRAAGAWQEFDAAVMAVHGDEALRLLADPDLAERTALSKIRYQPNAAVLHSDARMMPLRRRCWSAWNYVVPQVAQTRPIGITYWMNALQPIPKDDPLFVTLNDGDRIDPALVHDRTTFRHPLYDRAMLKGQAEVASLNGRRSTWFCGAWMRNGFHEDGLASALAVTAGLRGRSDAKEAA